MGCREHLSDSYRNTSKTETTSIRDSNHSDASDRVSLNTTHRGNKVQNMEAMDKVKQKIRKNTGETCREKGDSSAKVEVKKSGERNKPDIRHWLKKEESPEKETTHQGKVKKEVNSCEKEECEEDVINLEDDLSQAGNETVATSSEYSKVEK